MKNCAIGIDLGGAKIALGTADKKGRLLELVPELLGPRRVQ